MAFDSAELTNEVLDFFEHPLCGLLITDPGGRIMRANQTITNWVGSSTEALKARRFSDLLTIGGKIYYETHLGPLLRMQGYFDEVAVELMASEGEKKQVLINAFEHRNKDGQPGFVQITVFKAADRRLYEQNLKEEKAKAEQNLILEKSLSGMKEQFIAVLGHDLRNPLSSIVTGSTMLLEEPDLAQHRPIVEIISRSAARMTDLIRDILDFARARLGTGIGVIRKPTRLEPVLRHIVDEIAMAYPTRTINTDFNISATIQCDGSRIGQLCSNLLANALTHGYPDTPVIIRAYNSSDYFELTVSNQGKQIPSAVLEKIFDPFTREDHRPSQQGLGLGLFIASQIAFAHEGELFVNSNESETTFTLRF